MLVLLVCSDVKELTESIQCNTHANSVVEVLMEREERGEKKEERRNMLINNSATTTTPTHAPSLSVLA